MSEPTFPSAPAPRSLPDSPSLDWLRKQAKRRLSELRKADPAARLADAQLDLARQYGFSSWRALKAHVDSRTVDGQAFDAARSGDTDTLAALLDRHPDRLYARTQPYEHSLLHLAAANGHLAAVGLLLRRGLDVNVREKGDNTCPMHWAAAQGHLEVVRRLADAGGDVVGHGDDHALEVIGWATCFDQCQGAVAEFLVGRGARHHIFSAIAMNLADEVRRIVAADPAALGRPMSRNEDFRLPLHFAVLKNRPEMVALLLELGADPLATDGTGYPAAAYATAPDVDRSILEAIRARGGTRDLFTTLALEDWEHAERLWSEKPGDRTGVLHLMAKRNHGAAVRWLLDHGADPNALWSHWDAEVTPLHLAAAQGHAEVVRLLLKAGADPHIRDSKHDSDPIGWAYHFGQRGIVKILEAHDSAEAP
jgi:ankyrin repeat protein